MTASNMGRYGGSSGTASVSRPENRGRKTAPERLLGGLLVCGTLESHSSTREGVGKEVGDCSMVVACRRTTKIVVVKDLFERTHSF